VVEVTVLLIDTTEDDVGTVDDDFVEAADTEARGEEVKLDLGRQAQALWIWSGWVHLDANTGTAA
jgi:hypothetical protein